jgi:TATA-binding protein-associated factor
MSNRSLSFRLPSLVVCPSTLVPHWELEIQKFCASANVSTLRYSGAPDRRSAMLRTLSGGGESARANNECDAIVIVSYEMLRNDIAILSGIHFACCVLDEGHTIKNAKAGISVAAKQLRANHRLILSGTPLQNSVLELWSLFDFLMPEYLGSEAHFLATYSRPILALHSADCTASAQAAGEQALESLRRRVLPFILRRTKDRVAQDLPPKIVSDYLCEMGEYQSRLYDAFVESSAALHALVGADSASSSSSASASTTAPTALGTRALQELVYLRKLSTHPALVLTANHPDAVTITREIAAAGLNIDDASLSPKLLALRQILEDCGIGAEGGVVESTTSLAPARHRVLVFAQLKASLDLIAHSLFDVQMPHVSYARLDGTLEASKRVDVVQVWMLRTR